VTPMGMGIFHFHRDFMYSLYYKDSH
jgi:hypothetical protein